MAKIVALDVDVLARALVGAFAETTRFVLTPRKIDETNQVLERLVDGFRS